MGACGAGGAARPRDGARRLRRRHEQLGRRRCAAAASDQPVKGGTLTVTYQGEPTELDPAIAWEVTSWSIERLTYQTFLTYASEPGEAGTQLVPDLATEVPYRRERRRLRRRQDVHLPPEEGRQVRSAGETARSRPRTSSTASSA